MKSLVVGVALIALLCGGGVAYACVEQGPSGCQGGSGGGDWCETGLVWTSPYGESTNIGYVGCTVSLTPQTLTVAVTKLAPQDDCAFHAELENTYQKALSLTESVTVKAPKTCQYFVYGDNVLTSPPRVLDPGKEFGYQATISLSHSAPNACEGATATISVVIIGTESSKCTYVDAIGPATWLAAGLRGH